MVWVNDPNQSKQEAITTKRYGFLFVAFITFHSQTRYETQTLEAFELITELEDHLRVKGHRRDYFIFLIEFEPPWRILPQQTALGADIVLIIQHCAVVLYWPKTN